MKKLHGLGHSLPSRVSRVFLERALIEKGLLGYVNLPLSKILGYSKGLIVMLNFPFIAWDIARHVYVDVFVLRVWMLCIFDWFFVALLMVDYPFNISIHQWFRCFIKCLMKHTNGVDIKRKFINLNVLMTSEG